jgi:hypothetical protein
MHERCERHESQRGGSVWYPRADVVGARHGGHGQDLTFVMPADHHGEGEIPLGKCSLAFDRRFETRLGRIV